MNEEKGERFERIISCFAMLLFVVVVILFNTLSEVEKTAMREAVAPYGAIIVACIIAGIALGLIFAMAIMLIVNKKH